MKTIVAVIGDYYHDAAPIREALEQALSDADVRLEYAAAEELVFRLEQKPDAVILFKEDRMNPQEPSVERWMKETVAERIVRFVEEGGGWLAWHSGLASYAVESAYTKMLRGYFEYHPKEHQSVAYDGFYPDGTDGNAEEKVRFDIVDEHYFVHCDTDATEVFLRSRSVDGESIAGWRHAFGQGSVVCLTPAHRRDGLTNPEMVKLLRRSVNRCLR